MSDPSDNSKQPGSPHHQAGGPAARPRHDGGRLLAPRRRVKLNASTPLKRRRAVVVFPFRYPGAKRRLAELTGLKPKLVVEPFAVGVSVAWQLLATGHVDRIAIGEKNSWLASFWKVVFFDTDWLIKRVANIRVTLWQWPLMTVFDMFDDEASAVRSFAWGLRT